VDPHAAGRAILGVRRVSVAIEQVFARLLSTSRSNCPQPTTASAD
jgi:hypothetical protein